MFLKSSDTVAAFGRYAVTVKVTGVRVDSPPVPRPQGCPVGQFREHRGVCPGDESVGNPTPAKKVSKSVNS
jgi:hypothetical protein